MSRWSTATFEEIRTEEASRTEDKKPFDVCSVFGNDPACQAYSCFWKFELSSGDDAYNH